MLETEAWALLNYNINLNMQETNLKQHGGPLGPTRIDGLKQGLWCSH